MAAGDYVVRRNASNTDTIANTSGDLTLIWDTAVANQGSGITGGDSGASGVFTLGETGRFLVMWSDRITTTDTQNSRISFESFINFAGADIDAGVSSGYLRLQGNGQDYVPQGYAILDVATTTGNGDEFFIHHVRDDSTTASPLPSRDNGSMSGVTIIKLDDSFSYGLYSSSSPTTTSGTDNTVTTVDIGTTDLETGVFTISGNSVDMATTNPVLALYSLRVSTHNTGNRAETQARLNINAGTIEPGSWIQTYGPRNSNAIEQTAMSGICLLHPSSGDNVTLELMSRELGGDDWEGVLQLVELPSSAETISVEATGGNFHPGTAAVFAWDTLEQIDTAAFTHTAGNSNIDVDNDGDYIAFAQQAVTTDAIASVTRAIPTIQMRVNGTNSEAMGGGTYNRNNNTAGHGSVSCGGLLTGVNADESIEVWNTDDDSQNTGTLTCGGGAFSVIRLSSLFGAAETVMIAETVGYTITGTAITSEIGMPADTVAYTISGTPITTTKEFAMVAATVGYSISGTPVGLSQNLHVMVAETVGYSITGTAVTTIYISPVWKSEVWDTDVWDDTVWHFTADGAAEIVMTAETVAYTISGTAVGTLYNEVMIAANGAYVISGTAIETLYNEVLNADTFSYTISGTPVGTFKTSVLTADTVGYVITGTAVGLSQNLHVMIADTDSYVITGTDVGTFKTTVITAETVEYDITGTAVGLSQNLHIMVADTFSYTISGTAVGTFKTSVMVADTVGYLITGTPVTTTKQFVMEAETFSYTITGTDVGTFKTTVIEADTFAYTITGTAVGTSKSAHVMQADTIGYSITGTAVGTTVSILMTAETFGYTITGTAVGTAQTAHVMVADTVGYTITGTAVTTVKLGATTMDAETVGYAITGTAVGTFKTTVIEAETVSYSITGTDITSEIGMPANTVAYVISGTDITTTKLGATVMVADTVGYTITGTAVDTAKLITSMTADTVGYSITGTAVGTLHNKVLNADTVSYTLVGTDVGTFHDKELIAGVATYTITGTDVGTTQQFVMVTDTVAYTITGTAVSTTYTPIIPIRTYHVCEEFPTGQNDVTITIYYPLTGASIALDSNVCVEGGTSGLYLWDSSKLTTQPTGYQEYGYVMDDGVSTKGGIIVIPDAENFDKTLEVWRRLALDSSNPLTNQADGGIQATDIDIDAAASGDNIIQTRQ